MQLNQILDKYNQIESQLIYNKAMEIMSLISNDELGEAFVKYPKIFGRISNLTKTELLKENKLMLDAIDIFIEIIESRNLSKDEFDAMTLDDIKNYLNEIISSKVPCLLRIINELENDSRIKEN